jgi:FixJ family two-component response regulator
MSHAAPIVFVVDDVSEITVKAHRGRMMQKMKADSLPALVNMVTRLRLAPAHKG